MSTISKNEIARVGYYDSDGVRRFVISSNEDKTVYYLYKVDGEEYKKLGKARWPIDLVDKYKVWESLV